MAKLTAKKRKSLPAQVFGIPSERKYPMPDRAHAANAEARATQMVNRGLLSPATAAQIKKKAKGLLDR